MHLALVISSLGAGGAERVMIQLANYWASKGHVISLITLASPDAKPFYPLDSRVNLLQLGQAHSKKSLFIRIKSIISRVVYLRKNLHALNPDLVVSFIDLMNITVLLASTGLEIPTIISERIDPNYHFIPKIHQWLRLKTYPKATQLIVQTESAASYFSEGFKDLIKIIPNRIQKPSIQKNLYSKDVQKIITVGRLDKQKDHQTLILALANLLKFHPNLKLTIYGEGPERKNLEKLIISLNLKDTVFLPGTIPNIHEVLIDSDLFIFPSLYEGFPNALGEAMAAGLPVIASNCSGNVDIVQDSVNGRLFPAGDVNALIQVASEVIMDYEQRMRLACNAKKITDEFSADRIYALWDKILMATAKQTKEIR